MKRAVFACLGGAMLLLGLIGIVTPLLPTVPFLIVAAWCFGKSSPRVEAWMLNHPRFGSGLRRWREEGAIPRRAKWMAVMGIAVGYAVFWTQARPGWIFATVVAVLMLGSAIYVLSRPGPRVTNR
jgi:uncharacterized membrane protein YbaN (DUF454 family)